MTKQELQKLTRLDLIELLLQATLENEQLHRDLEEAKARLESREITTRETGNMAETTLRLNGVVEAAQAAADQYLENIRMRNDNQELYLRMKQETLEKCNRMIRDTEAQVNDYLNQVRSRLREINGSGLLEIHED